MKRHSFSTFQVDAGNREAFEICRAVADRQRVSPLPVVMVGDDGCGKTHLVYSIIHHIRANSADTGLACVTAHEFPEAVRALIADPSPLRRAASAVLLVDQVESFTQRLDELEALVRLFLDLRHYVVMASSVHPRRIRRLTPGLRALLDGGQIVPIRPRIASAAQETAEPEMRRRLEAEQGRNADLRHDLEAEREAQRALHEEIERATAEVNALRREIDKSQTEVAALSGLNAEIARLNQQLQRAQAERETAEQERMALAARLREKAGLQEEANALRLELHVAHEQSEQAQQETGRLHQRAQGVLAHVEANRVKFAQAGSTYEQQIQGLETLIAQQLEHTGGNGASVLDALTAERDDLEAELALARSEAQQAARARDEALDKLDRLTAAQATLDLNLLRTREALSQREQDLEALRQEAAAQVAAAHARTGETEHAYVRLHTIMESSQHTAHDVLAGLRSLRQQLTESSEAAEHLAAQLEGTGTLETGDWKPETRNPSEPSDPSDLSDRSDDLQDPPSNS